MRETSNELVQQHHLQKHQPTAHKDMLHSAAKAGPKNLGRHRHHIAILNGGKNMNGWRAAMRLFEENGMEHIMEPSTNRQRESMRQIQ